MEKQLQSQIEIFCLRVKDKKTGEFFILYLNRERANKDTIEIPQNNPEKSILERAYPVFASQETFQRICQNGGRLNCFGQKAPKCGQSC